MHSPVTKPAAAVINHLINPFFGNYPSYPSFGMLHVPIVTGDQMNMDVRDGLTCRLSHVNTHVVPVWPEISVRLCLCLPNQFKRGLSLAPGQLKKAHHVPKRNDQ